MGDGEDHAAEVTSDRLLGGAVTLLQPRRGHRAGTDAVLLATLAEVRPGDRVVDLGSASGAVGLMIAHRVPGTRLTFVDREEELVALCQRNIGENGLGERATALCRDVFELAAGSGLEGEAADVVVTNPPFFGGDERASPDPGRRAAHAMRGGDLAGWIAGAASLLKPRGRLWMIHRADRLHECLRALDRIFGGIVLVPVYPREGTPASRVVLGATKNSRAPMRIAPPLILHGPGGEWTEATAALHGSAAIGLETKRAPEGALD